MADISEEVLRLDKRLYDMESVLTAYEAEYRMQYHAIPIKLDDNLYALAGRSLSGERPPTDAQKSLFDEYAVQYEKVRNSMMTFVDADLDRFNKMLKSAGVEPVSIPAHITPQ